MILPFSSYAVSFSDLVGERITKKSTRVNTAYCSEACSTAAPGAGRAFRIETVRQFPVMRPSIEREREGGHEP